MILLISLPVILEATDLLRLWLGIVPDYAVIFTQLMIAITAVDAISNPLMTLAQANGNIKMYSIVNGSLLLTIVPLSYVCLKLSLGPTSVFIVALTIATICLFARMLLLKRMVNFDIFSYMKKSLLPILMVTIVASVPPILLKENMNIGNVISFILVICTSVFSTIIAALFLGMSSVERQKIFKMIHIDRIFKSNI